MPIVGEAHRGTALIGHRIHLAGFGVGIRGHIAVAIAAALQAAVVGIIIFADPAEGIGLAGDQAAIIIDKGGLVAALVGKLKQVAASIEFGKNRFAAGDPAACRIALIKLQWRLRGSCEILGAKVHRQEVSEFLLGRGKWQNLKQIALVFVGFKVVCFCRFDKPIQAGSGLSPFGCSCEKKNLSSLFSYVMLKNNAKHFYAKNCSCCGQKVY